MSPYCSILSLLLLVFLVRTKKPPNWRDVLQSSQPLKSNLHKADGIRLTPARCFCQVSQIYPSPSSPIHPLCLQPENINISKTVFIQNTVRKKQNMSHSLRSQQVCFQDWGLFVFLITRGCTFNLVCVGSHLVSCHSSSSQGSFSFCSFFFFKCLGEGAADGRISLLTLYGVFQKNKVNMSRDGRAAIIDYLSTGCEAAAAETTERRGAKGVSSRSVGSQGCADTLGRCDKDKTLFLLWVVIEGRTEQVEDGTNQILQPFSISSLHSMQHHTITW